MDKKITLPISKDDVEGLSAGDCVYLTGTLYTARDAAHKRLHDAVTKGEGVPFPLRDAVVYYLGPTPAREGQVIGSAGPTTSGRMDAYTPLLIEQGMNGMIGKGKRSKAVVDAMKRHKAVYFAAVGGAGALLSRCIKQSEVVAYGDLGTEAVRKLRVEDFPVIVAVDCRGNSLYET